MEHIYSLTDGRYRDELPEGFDLLSENFNVSAKGSFDQIPPLVSAIADLVAALSRKDGSIRVPPADGILEPLGVREAARCLGCSSKTIHKLCSENLLTFHWVGNKRRFIMKDVEDYRDRQRHVDSKPTDGVPSAADKKKGGDDRNIHGGMQGSDAGPVTSKEIRELCQR